MDQTAIDELYEAFAVLAGSDPDSCSYKKGYMKRQAVFSCNTCVQTGMQPAGVCLACANECHDGHDVTELYTKRNFRCDCGNNKFCGFKCKLQPGKDGLNAKNLYNHNYFGRYCSCDKPYPNEDDQVNDEMIQCIVCEDWYHAKHLDSLTVDCDALMEMVCVGCMNRAPFLWTYAAHFAVLPLHKQSSVQTNASHVRDENKKSCSTRHTHDVDTSQCCQTDEKQTIADGASSNEKPHDSSNEVQGSTERCIFKGLKAKDLKGMREAAVFWPYYWRSELCTCTGCKKMYVETGVQFLLDESDTLLAYEEKAKTQTCSDLILSCLSTMDHVQQLEIIYRFNDLKEDLSEFLQQYGDQRKEVTPEVFREFLEQLQSRKRRRVNSE